MKNRENEALLILRLAAERGFISQDGAHEWQVRANTLSPEQASADQLVEQKVLTAEQLAELRAGLETMDRPAADTKAAPPPSAARPGPDAETLADRPEALADWPEALPEIEGYRITGRLGEGGMGVVWRAVQLSTRREVALKLLGARAFGSGRARKRFEREVELTARLEHPNIGRVYDSGLYRGMYYYAMELVHGVRLDEYARSQGLSQVDLLELMLKVCQAVEHAHRRGIIHRDLKPSNIMVTDDGEPHVLDFGLAKALEADADGEPHVMLSVEGSVTGTPAFMPPEQAAGHSDKADTRSDVYSLGVILFTLLTGQSPHDLTGSPHQVLSNIIEEDVRRPRDVTTTIDRELEAVLLKAMARQPEARYASAGGLAQDLDSYLNAEPLTVKPWGPLQFLYRVARRHAVPIGICVVAVFVLGLRLSGGLQPLELMAYDAFLGLRPDGSIPEPPITIIGITEEDIEAMGTFPVPDDRMAELLASVAGMGARAIGIDVYRDLRVGDGRAALNAVLTEHPEITAVMQLGVDRAAIAPPDILEGTDQVGFADQAMDPDGVIRRGLLFMDDDEQTYYSLGLRVALSYLGPLGIRLQGDDKNPGHVRLGRATIPPFESNDGPYVNADAGGYQFLLDYRGPSRFRTFSLGDVGDGRVEDEAVRDRVVLIGVMADSTKDYVNIPGRPNLYGVEMQAICVDQLLRFALDGQEPMRSLSDWLEGLWILVCVVAGGLVGLASRSMALFLLTGAGGVAAITLLACVLFCFGGWMPVVPPVMGWVGAWLLAGPYRRHRRRSL